MMLLLESISLLIIIGHALCGLNHMTRTTSRAIVLAVSLIFAAGMARVWSLLAGDAVADASTALLLAAIAAGMLVERRRADTCPCLPSLSSRQHDDHHGGIPT